MAEEVCRRCKARNLDVTVTFHEQVVEIRYVCLDCGYSWVDVKPR
jgi:transposase-like protein